MKKNIFKYIAMLITCLLLAQSAFAGESVAMSLNSTAMNCSDHSSMGAAMMADHPMLSTDVVFNSPSDSSLNTLFKCSSSQQQCNHVAMCAMAFHAGLVSQELGFSTQKSAILFFPITEYFDSQQYSPPVPPPLAL